MDETIATLTVSQKKKEELQWVQDHIQDVSSGTLTSFPKVTFNGEPKKWEIFSLWGFFFQWIAYLVRGMWRKSLVLLGAGILLNTIALLLVEQGVTAGLILYYGVFLYFGWLCGVSYKWDCYRKFVKKEVFWW